MEATLRVGRAHNDLIHNVLKPILSKLVRVEHDNKDAILIRRQTIASAINDHPDKLAPMVGLKLEQQ